MLIYLERVNWNLLNIEMVGKHVDRREHVWARFRYFFEQVQEMILLRNKFVFQIFGFAG